MLGQNVSSSDQSTWNSGNLLKTYLSRVQARQTCKRLLPHHLLKSIRLAIVMHSDFSTVKVSAFLLCVPCHETLGTCNSQLLNNLSIVFFCF